MSTLSRVGRAGGLLLHPTSLPGPHGIGTLGADARGFVDFLADAGQRVWQVLPLGPTGYGDSPYQALSALAGNPLLIDLDTLVDEGLLDPRDVHDVPPLTSDRIDFERVIPLKRRLLAAAFARFDQNRGALGTAFDRFCDEHRHWLDDFALFAAVKRAHGDIAWAQWAPSIAHRDPGAVRSWRARLPREVDTERFLQFLFFRQWQALRAYCHRRGVHIMGDVPIFVAHDSADVWAHREFFALDPAGQPRVVAGVPPDYFSVSGQLWGNPHYRWDVMAADGFAWWVGRFRATLAVVDLVRLDHFRGFESYWEIPWPSDTAVRGRWVEGPGAALFDTLQAALGDLPVVAENLGVITPAVEALRHRFGFPGMAILQFAFGSDPQAPDFQPHTYPRDRVVYTGTHDNDTTVGWWTGAGAGDSTRTPEDVRRERELACRYLGTDGREIHWTLIRAALASAADLAIVPAQDLLGLDSEARMNVPGKPTGNWRWRYLPGALTPALAERLRNLTETCGRAGRSPVGGQGAPVHPPP